MGRVNNQQAKQYVLDRKPFRGLNIFGRRLRNHGYCVFSYDESWPVYLWNGGDWYGNGSWISSTTTRHTRLLRPAEKISWLPRAVIQLFVAYCDTAGCFSGVNLVEVLRNAGFITPPAARAAPPVVHTHLANAVVDWSAVHRRRVMPV